jgi:hypothetical protein
MILLANDDSLFVVIGGGLPANSYSFPNTTLFYFCSNGLKICYGEVLDAL